MCLLISLCMLRLGVVKSFKALEDENFITIKKLRNLYYGSRKSSFHKYASLLVRIGQTVFYATCLT
jgi:hypothetical protein